MPFYGSDCVSFSFHFSSFRPGFRAIRVAARLTHRRVMVVIVSVPLRAFSGNGFPANPHVRKTQARAETQSAQRKTIFSLSSVMANLVIQRACKKPHVIEYKQLRIESPFPTLRSPRSLREKNRVPPKIFSLFTCVPIRCGIVPLCGALWAPLLFDILTRFRRAYGAARRGKTGRNGHEASGQWLVASDEPEWRQGSRLNAKG